MGFRGSRLYLLILSSLIVTLGLVSVFGGVIPHDDGMMAEIASRVGRGEVPHLDFLEPYSGGINYYHAAVFSLAGESLLNLRAAFLPVYFAAALSFFGIMRTFVPNRGALEGTLIYCLIGPTLYWAALPARYISCLYVIALWLAVKFVVTGGRWKPIYLAAAGGICGLMLLMKISALIYLSAIAYGVVLASSDSAIVLRHGRLLKVRSLKLVACLVLSLGVAVTLSGFIAQNLSYAIVFLVPLLLTGAYFGPRCQTGEEELSPRECASGLAFLLVGFSLTLLLSLFVYSASELYTVLKAVISQVQAHTARVVLPPPDVVFLGVVAAIALVACGKFPLGTFGGLIAFIVLFASAGGGSLSPVSLIPWFGTIACSILLVAPSLLLIGSAALPSPGSPHSTVQGPLKRLLIAQIALLPLNLFPWTHALNVAYLAPALVPLVGMFVREYPRWRRGTLTMVVLSTLALQLYAKTSLRVAEWVYSSDPRIGILLPRAIQEDFATIKSKIQAEIPPDQTIFAGPDLPHIPFLVGRSSAIDYFFDLARPTGPPSSSELEQILSEQAPGGAVISTRSKHSPPYSEPQLEVFERYFGRCERWRDYLIFTQPVHGLSLGLAEDSARSRCPVDGSG